MKAIINYTLLGGFGVFCHWIGVDVVQLSAGGAFNAGILTGGVIASISAVVSRS